MNIILIHNAKSGSALPLASLKKKFKKNDITIEKDIQIGPGFEKRLKPFLKPKQIIVVIGGDGTVSAVAGLVTGTSAILAPLPGGTLNHFTKDLGIAQDINEAIAHLKKAKQQKIDIAQVNNIPFINNSSIGLYPSSLQVRESTENKVGKWPAAIFGILRAIAKYKTYTITLNKQTFTTPFIFVGNNPYKISDFGISNRTSLKNHTLSVYIAKTHTRQGLVIIFLNALVGRLHNIEQFDSLLTKEITIKTHHHKKIHVSHDGEISKIATPLQYKIIASGLTVLT